MMFSQQDPAHAFQPRYQEYVHTLAAGQVIVISADTDFVHCIAATDDFKIRFDNAPEGTFKRGLKYVPGQTIHRVEIRNNGTSPNTIELGMGRGDMLDARLSVPQEMLNAMFTPDTGNSSEITVNGAPIGTTIANENKTRRELIIENRGANYVVLNFTNAAVTHGFSIQPGEKISLDHAGYVYANAAHVLGGVAAVLWVTERGFNIIPAPGGP